MEEYSLNPAEYGTHKLVASEIGTNNLVLDVGCNKGYLKKVAPNNIFYGIDYDEKDLQEASDSGYKKVYKLDLNKFENFKSDKKFDFLLFADILEHLSFPDKVLRFFVENYLKQNGRVIISLPNVANFSVRLNLLRGNFDYSESGILDKTHLHLYTLKSAKEMIARCDLKIVKVKFSSNHLGRLIKIFPFLSTLLGYNLIFLCQRKS